MRPSVFSTLISVFLITLATFPHEAPARVYQIASHPIVYSYTEATQYAQIHIIEGDGSGLKVLTPSSLGNALGPVWSPDGKRIAFSAPTDGDKSGIFVMDAQGLNLKRITTRAIDALNPVWSPDGKSIAMQCVEGLVKQICTISADGSNFKQLTDGEANWYPAWSPSGKKIVFESVRNHRDEIYTMNADGSGQMKLTDSNTGKGVPVWSPDGKQVVFTGRANKRSDIYSINEDGSALINLTQNLPGSSSNPVWSPDGNYLAFNTKDDNAYLAILRSGEVNPKIIRESVLSGELGGPFLDLAWSPDSKNIAFVSDEEDPARAGIYVLPIACIDLETGCKTKDYIKLKANLVSPHSTSDYPSHLNWAYLPSTKP